MVYPTAEAPPAGHSSPKRDHTGERQDQDQREEQTDEPVPHGCTRPPSKDAEAGRSGPMAWEASRL